MKKGLKQVNKQNASLYTVHANQWSSVLQWFSVDSRKVHLEGITPVMSSDLNWLFHATL